MRVVVVAALLAIVACRSDVRRDVARSAMDSAQANAVLADSIDGCHQTGGPKPDTSIVFPSERAESWRRAFAGGAEFRCAINSAIDLRLVVAGDTTIPSIDSIVVYSLAATRPAYVLSLAQAAPEMPAPYATDVVRAFDLDADGNRDLMVGTSWGATGNTSYAVWRFDPARKRLVADSLLSSVFNPTPVRGRPCVRTSSNSSARDHGTGLYCLHAGRWQLDSAEQNEWDRRRDAVIHTVLVRRGDSLVIVKRETLPDSL
jgi:hypothetical protein